MQAREKAGKDPYADSTDDDGLESALDDAVGGTAGEVGGAAVAARDGVVTAGLGTTPQPSNQL